MEKIKKFGCFVRITALDW